MAEVEQIPEEMSNSVSSITSQCKMSTSESEHSLTDGHLHPPNRALIFMKHVSDYDENDNTEENGDITGGEDETVLDSDKFNKNYFTMAYTDNESNHSYNNNELHEDYLNTSFSLDENDNNDVDEDEYNEDDITNTTLVPSTSAKKSLMKLFSPEKLPLRKFQMENQLEEKLSPMDVSDVSSPDSHKSISEEVTRSIGAFSLSEDSLTYIVDCKPKIEIDDSLDEISSGEISSDTDEHGSHVSQNISEFWDDERYLSEYNYDEPIDEDRAKKLLSFGDDYRNFIDSLSESYSSISSLSIDRRKRSKRMRKKTVVHPQVNNQYDTQSEAENDNMSNVLVDSEREMSRVTQSLDMCQEEGFIKPDCYNQYNDLMGICQDNLAIIIDCLQSAELQDTFVSKRKSRDLRVLLNKWEKLLSKIKENIQHTEVYESLKNDIVSLRLDLTKVLEDRERDEETQDDVELEQNLHTFRQAMSQLCDFKSQLFNLNLSVHNFLAELHATSGANKKFNKAVHLKEDVADLYKLWDRAHHNTVGNITRTEDLLAKLRMFETEVVQLQTLLNQDKRKIRHRFRPGASWSADSGISDDSGEWVTDSDERLAKLKLIADSLRRNLPADSPSLQIIDRTLQTTSDQLEDFHRSCKKIVQKVKPKLKRRPSDDKRKPSEVVVTSYLVDRRKKVVKMALVMNFLLFITAIICWLCQPSCCENFNTMYLLPKLSYVNGPPPI